MSDETTAPAEETKPKGKKSTAPAESAPATDVIYQVRVLENGLRLAGGVAAKGKLLNVRQSRHSLESLQSLEQLGKIRILGAK